jgi:hypothetical protein
MKIPPKALPKDSIDLLAEVSGGDARVALGNLELALQLAGVSGKITKELVKTAAQKRVPGYDKNGEQHYNIISAFIKSMRGSMSAALYYMARMLQAGEDPKFVARRMVIFASEDIGMAAPARSAWPSRPSRRWSASACRSASTIYTTAPPRSPRLRNRAKPPMPCMPPKQPPAKSRLCRYRCICAMRRPNL